MLKWQRKNVSPLLRWGILAAVTFALVAVFGDQGLLKLRQMGKEEAQLQSKIAGIELENRRLAYEIERLEDRNYLEKVVRDELGYLRPDEVIFYIEKELP